MKKEGVIVLGASGHAKVVIELLRASGLQVDYCVGGLDSPESCLGVAVLKGDEHLQHLRENGYTRAFVAIGSNALRQRLAHTAREAGFHLVNAISPTAVISPTARLGKGIAIMAGVIINAESVIEDLAIINTGATIDHDCRIGQAVHIAPQCALAGNVSVSEAAFLGIGCKIIPGIKIGEGATIGAGGVVVSDIPARTLAVGIPARVIKNMTTLSETR